MFFTSCKFILGLSNYNGDDTILDREYEMKQGGNVIDVTLYWGGKPNSGIQNSQKEKTTIWAPADDY